MAAIGREMIRYVLQPNAKSFKLGLDIEGSAIERKSTLGY
jgi:hypothetical protein